ncbi:MAG: transposase [Marmoricola sp.]
MGRQGFSAEYRRKVLDLLVAGRSVASVAHDLDLSDQPIYNWRRQDRIDRGLQPGLSTAENAELTAAKKRMRCRPSATLKLRLPDVESSTSDRRRQTELPPDGAVSPS